MYVSSLNVLRIAAYKEQNSLVSYSFLAPSGSFIFPVANNYTLSLLCHFLSLPSTSALVIFLFPMFVSLYFYPLFILIFTEHLA